MNIPDNRQDEIRPQPHPAPAADEPHTQRLPPGRELDMRPRRPKAFLLLTIALTLLLASAVIVIRGNKPNEDAGSSAPPADPGIAPSAEEVTPADPALGIERRVEELGTQLALHRDEVSKEIEENARTIRALEEKLASLPTLGQVTALEDALKQSRDALTKDITRLDQSFARLRRAMMPKAAKPAEATLPFQLVSLDLWDGTPYVGLIHDGRIELLRAGQARGGWTVEAIDRGNGKVRFRNAVGQTIEQTVGR